MCQGIVMGKEQKKQSVSFVTILHESHAPCYFSGRDTKKAWCLCYKTTRCVAFCARLWQPDNVRVLDNADNKCHIFHYLCYFLLLLVANSNTGIPEIS